MSGGVTDPHPEELKAQVAQATQEALAGVARRFDLDPALVARWHELRSRPPHRREVERLLRESERRYQTLFDAIDQGFCILEMIFDAEDHPVDYRFLEINPVFAEQTGLVDAVGKTARTLVPDLDDFWFETYGRVAQTGEPARFQHHAQAMGRWFDVYAVRIGGSESRRVALLFSDITARREAEHALRESEQRFRRLANTMPQLVWISRPDGRPEYFNQRWFDLTDAERRGPPEGGWQDLIHPDDRARVLEAWWHSLRTGEPFEAEGRLRRGSGGGHAWFLGRALPVRDETGKIGRWFGTCTEIEDLKRAEAALWEADRRKDEFLAMLSHELRNPLASLAVAVDLLDRDDLDPDEGRQLRTVARRQVGTLSRLVDDLLDVSRITRGRVLLRREPLDLRTVAQAALQSMRTMFEAKRHTLAVTVPDAPLPVTGDPVRLEQVLMNLLTNAAKYTPAGGHIEVRLERGESGAVVRVRDTGIGLAPEALEQVFDLFGQAQPTIDRGEGGLGVGLTIVRDLVERHGGTVEAFSPGLGQGAEFVVRLPLARPPSKEGPALAPEPPAAPAPKQILLVDDNTDAAWALSLLLQGEGHTVTVAHDGREGLAEARERGPDIVVLDIGLPGLDGYEIARRLRRDPRTRNATLVAVTGYGQATDRQQAERAGFDAHFVKPVDLDALLDFLHRA